MFDMINPAFCRFTGIPYNASVWFDGWFYGIIAIAFVAGTLSAGIYSSTGVYSAAIVKVLKGEKAKSRSGLLMKKGLVTMQFAIGIALIAATVGVYLQYRYVTNKKPGFTIDNIITVNAPLVGDSTLPTRYKTFTDKVRNIPGVQGCAFSSVIPGQSNMFNRGGIYQQGTDEKDSKNYRVTETGSGFFDTYKIRFIAGEGFAGNPAIDRNKVVINAYASATLGFKKPQDAVGRTIMMEGRPFEVSGVVIDFHQRSAKEAIEPQIFRYPQRLQGKFSINAGLIDQSDLIGQVKRIYDEVFPNNPYTAGLLKDYYGLQFEQEKQYTVVYILFSLLVIFITILGLVGLSAYTAEQRKKELGIRKTLGASEGWLFFLVFRDYIILCLLAAIIALPLFHYEYLDWLANFAMHIDPQWWLYLLPIVIVLGISMITVWIQSSKIINTNPVDNLKYE
jgi:putative ABC transport system permease protein